MAVEFAPKVRVNAVVVGLVVTEQAHLFYGDEEGIAAVGATVPLGRMADPTDVADVCLFLASPLARYVSGAEVLVHGGGEQPALHGRREGNRARLMRIDRDRLEGKVGAGHRARRSGIGAACVARGSPSRALRVARHRRRRCPTAQRAATRSSPPTCATPTSVTRPRSTASSRISAAVDVLVNAAGVSSFGTRRHDRRSASGTACVGVNLKGTWLVARAVLPGMVAARRAAAS